MINVNQITSMLAKLPDQSLQKYAAMHKNDPYVMALAVAESNRRKEMRAAGQGQMGVQQQPKVVDQDIASMAAPMPEDQGIAQLPAGDMDFADGGIVAFAGDGPSQFVRDISALPERWDAWKRDLAKVDARVAAEEKERLARQQARDEAGMKQGILNYLFGTPEAAQQGKADMTALQAQDTARALTDSVGPTFTPGGESGLRPEAVAPKADSKDKTAPAPGTGSAAAAPGFGGIAAALNKPLDVAATKSPFQSDLEAANAERVAARQAELSGIKDIQAKYADAFKGREERLTKREEALGTMKDQSLGLALLQAGAAMMTTPGGIGQAIGKGVDVGSKQYATGIERVRAAQDKLSDARDRLEELKLNRDEMSDREVLKATSAIKEQEAAGKEMLIKANMDMYKIDREEAMKRLELQTRVGIAQIEQQGRSQMYATPERMAYEGILASTVTKDKPKGDPVKAYEILQSSKREPVSRDAALKSWSGDMLLQQKYPNFEDYYKIAQGPSAAQFNPADQALIDKYSSKK